MTEPSVTLAQVARTCLLRELGALTRLLDDFPDDADVWRTMPGIINTTGTLTLHLAGNLQYYVGTVLGGTGYVRDRDAEFTRRNVPRGVLIADLAAAMTAIDVTLMTLPARVLDTPYPELLGGGVQLQTGDFLIHLVAHTAYHVGQADYHRRAVTGRDTPIGAMRAAEVATVRH